LKLNRTLNESPRHRLASLGNPKKKKCSLLSLFSRGDFFKNGKDIFLFGVLPSKYSGSVARLQFGLGFAKTIFWGKGFGKTSADLPPTERGLGNECERARTLQNRWDMVYLSKIRNQK